MTYTEKRQATQTKTEILSFADRVTIASVLTWDGAGIYTYSPDEIESIQLVEDMVLVRLSENRSEYLSRYLFRSILEALRSSAAKQIESVIAAEEQEVLAAEREMSEIIQAAAQEELEQALELTTKYDWLTQPLETESLVACHQCGGHGCEYCGYQGLKPEPKPVAFNFAPMPDKSAYRFQLEASGYRVLVNGKPLGRIQKIRNEAQNWSNTPDSYYWVTFTSKRHFKSPTEAAQSLG
jgi:hypothetical protein